MAPLATKPDPPTNGATGGLHADPRWQLVERILQTSPFQKSPNLRSLFSYLAEYSILGKAECLTERQVGIAVFAKPADYSPAEDSAVRVHVRQLRLRLHEYFGQEGRHEDQRVDIPKGSYVLEFKASLEEPATTPEPASTHPPVAPVRHAFPLQTVLMWTAVAAAVVSAIGWYRAAKAPAARPGVPWPLNAVIQPGRQTTVVTSDANLSILRFLAPSEVSLDDYLQPGFRETLIPKNPNGDLGRMLTYVSHSELTSFADAAALSAIVKAAGSGSDQISLTSARDLDRRDLERGNYIFVGSAISNPWVALFADKLNFQVVEEGIGGRMYFLNRNPKPGEQKEYEGLARTGSNGDDFATISLLPGKMGQGNILLLQGLRQEGTEALGVLLADADDRAQLQKATLHGSGRSPYFEALIRSRAIAGAPVSIEIVAIRTIQP